MTKIATTLLASAAFALASAAGAAERTGDAAAVEHVLRSYEKALNASDTDAVMQLYSPDAVFMPQNNPSMVSADAVRAGYVKGFGIVKLSVRFDIAEIVQVAPDWAFARTNSSGSITIRANGQTQAEANQELFVLHKLAPGGWKIARYSFSTTNPPNPPRQ